eukprot:TRINITY_DN3442_c0_g1_i1.p1 TRINITY_DN3442_c0_g1~~TRINITY_DN3442_c0_g1_i1.p1  ORF type:complete len:384 (+),score=29.75 TRINITY_DN3442_c0_g1_i1:371-1522(+)
MSSVRPDIDFHGKSEPSTVDHFDRLPDSLLLLVFNRIGDVKALGRCCVVSRRFHCLVPQVDNVVVKVDCVISDDDAAAAASASAASYKGRSIICRFIRLFLGGIVRPLQAITQFLGSKPRSISLDNAAPVFSGSASESSSGEVSHHSPTEVLKNFNEIRTLQIELPGGELGIDDGVLLKWKADFGSTLDSCIILGASSVLAPGAKSPIGRESEGICGNEDNGSIPESFYTNGGLKLRVVWTISSLIAASARHYLLQPIIAEHATLESLVLTDSDRQGVLRMNREQLEELRVKPLSASASANRTLVPALNMKLWYAPHLELPDGTVLIGATLVAIHPSEQTGGAKKEALTDGGCWVSSAFEEPFRTAAKLLVKRRTYCLEMNSF